MMRSMFAGVSGLRSHQTMMDVVGHNIANVNTAGYKASQVTFQEALAQVVRGPSGSGADRGGINALQLGLGTKVASIDGVFTQGATQLTGRATDLAVQGEGFFMITQGSETLYTRAGAFSFDEVGNLVAPGGLRVMGWTADASGTINPDGPVGEITLPVAQVIEPKLTSTVDVGGNISSDAAVGDKHTTSVVIYDSLGNDLELVVQFEKTAANTWDVTASTDGNSLTAVPTTITFGTDGSLSSATTIDLSGFTPPGADPLDFDLILGGSAPLVQFGGDSTAEAFAQDGNAIGFLRTFAIGNDGSVTGQFSNGETQVLARIATAAFNNPAGLTRIGDSHFAQSVNSGEPLIGEPGTGNRGLLSAGALEMSNVDLALEFTELIRAQRGFQANSRVVTSADELLQEIVNLKR